ncbi:MAG: glycosyltransferase [Tannerella sp.]|jgi:glycosyltransferase involved in cell wall biosynthesis|nr:glycosyltransferase [Tannerella sp.]
MKISIITIVHNGAETISHTFDSILRQTYKNIEYIVVDGASTDHTVDIIKAYEPAFGGCMKWISEPDRGLYDAINKGIGMATGDVVGCLNSDDFYTRDDVLSVVANTLKDERIDAVFGDVHFVKPYNLDKCVRYYSSKRFHPHFLRIGFMPAHPSFYIRRRCYEKYGIYSLDYTISSDFDLMVRFFYKHRLAYRYIPMDFVTMRTGGTSTKSIKSRIQLNKEDIKACRKYGVYTNWVYMLSRYCYKIKEFITHS